MELPWDGGTTVYSTGSGHMTKMAAMPIYGKNLRNQEADDIETWYATSSASTKFVHLMNQEADDIETWYATSSARVLPSLFI